MSKFDEYIGAVVEGAKGLSKDTFGDFLKEADSDTKLFVDQIKPDLARWSSMFMEKAITEQQFRDFVEGKEELAVMHALTLSGIALAKCERFRSGLIDLLINSAFNIFGK